MTYNKLLSLWQKKAIKENKEESAILILMLNAFKLTQTYLYIKMDEKPDKDKIEQFEKDCNKYIYDNIPCQYITGEAYFYGYNYNVNEDVLIPRHETEELVENILKLYDHNFKGQKVKTVDVGTGSGCISCTLALEEKNMEVYATDISFEALKVAKSILKGDMTVKEAEDIVKPAKKIRIATEEENSLTAELISLKENLSDTLNAKVDIKLKGKKGEIVIKFNDLSELNNITTKLNNI